MPRENWPVEPGAPAARAARRDTTPWESADAALAAKTPQQFVDAVASLCTSWFGEREATVTLRDDAAVVSPSGSAPAADEADVSRPDPGSPVVAKEANGLAAAASLDTRWHLHVRLHEADSSSDAPEQLLQMMLFLRRCWGQRVTAHEPAMEGKGEGPRSVSRIGHDLRTSLHNFALASQLLGAHVQPSGQAILQRVTRNVATMKTLLDELTATQK